MKKYILTFCINFILILSYWMVVYIICKQLPIFKWAVLDYISVFGIFSLYYYYLLKTRKELLNLIKKKYDNKSTNNNNSRAI